MEATAIQMEPETTKINLDPQQHEAVYTDAHDVLCLAGAGSGKTRVIVERVAHLIEDCKVSPSEIIAFTFTRKAAGELRSRIQDRIGYKASRITIGTIHGVAFNLLRRFGELLGYTPQSLTVYGEWEEKALLRHVAEDIGALKGKTWKVPKKEIDRVFQKYYSEGVEPDENDPVRPVFTAMLSRCRENNALTYGMILTAFRELLPKIYRHLTYKHLFLDEAQDTDLLQWDIIENMQAYFMTDLFIVGDVDQSIYSWRGAVPGYLLDNLDTLKIYKIENNYRSYPRIVNAAQNLIGHNQNRFSKTMRATRTEAPNELMSGETVYVVPNKDSAGLSKMISGLLKIPGIPDQITVLARNHFLLDRLSDELDLLNVEHKRIGRKMELTNSEEFRQFHAFLKLLVNPHDNFAFLLIRQFLDVSPDHYNQIRYQSAKEDRSHFQVWLDSEYPGSFFKDYDSETWSFTDTVCRLATILDPSKCGYLPLVDPSAIRAIEKFCLAWVADHPAGTLVEYLEWLATYDLQDEIKDEQKGLQLMTIHASKGLEWPMVFVAGCNEGLLPSKRAIESGDIEEERRLMYVAMTRARDMLILAVRPEQKVIDGRVYESPVSRFISELDLREGE